MYSAPALRSGVTAVGVGWADGTGGAIGGQVEVMGLRRVGVEEELLLVEPGLGRPRAVAGTVLHAARQVATGPAAVRTLARWPGMGRRRWTLSCSCSSWRPIPSRAGHWRSWAGSAAVPGAGR